MRLCVKETKQNTSQLAYHPHCHEDDKPVPPSTHSEPHPFNRASIHPFAPGAQTFVLFPVVCIINPHINSLPALWPSVLRVLHFWFHLFTTLGSSFSGLLSSPDPRLLFQSLGLPCKLIQNICSLSVGIIWAVGVNSRSLQGFLHISDKAGGAVSSKA